VNHYDLLLLDMHMPIIDGLEVTQQVRLPGSAHRNVPIIALTGSASKPEQQLYLENGVDEILLKPFAIKTLRQKVLQWLNQRSSFQD
jgi:CheY-like chemotaxis protein